MKIIFIFTSLILSVSAFANEYKMTAETQVFKKDGTLMFDGIHTVTEFSLTSKPDGTFQPKSSEKTLDANGKVKRVLTQDGRIFSALEVKDLINYVTTCSLRKGSVEMLAIKAGSFLACKIQKGNITSWHIDGLPFEVKKIQQDNAGSLVFEAISINK